MQKRRAHAKNASLPMTEADVKNGNSSRWKPARIRKKRKGNSRGIPGMVGMLGVVAMVVGGFFLFNWGTPETELSRRRVNADSALPLSQYTSLKYGLAHSQLVGLYYAAAWCPMSTPVTQLIHDHLGDKLLPPPHGDVAPPVDRAPMSLVYISSDRNEEAFERYQGPNWMAVPFGSEEQTSLKKHFSVCAKPEMGALGIERKFEIPTLIILDGETHGVITTNGAEDLQEYGDKALEHWMDLHNLVRAMEDKYEREHQGLPKPQDRRVHQGASFSSLFE